jgi:hypothetical protein
MKQQVDVFFHSQQPYTYVRDEDLAQYPSGRLDFPNELVACFPACQRGVPSP